LNNPLGNGRGSRIRTFGPSLGVNAADRRRSDEMMVRIAGERMYLWRAVDHEGMLVQGRR
jgi:transposase-like protein